ncbi:4'-phosphopantetheinyl transferase family protein [Streptomyces katsurahamanus]|uniref:4'-phosphopantetheinyl transferase superfamily protein n=1 Tax=Streptomyces katsurahamanus TaxID=2577098 RepID=A0ABW9NSV6_9ACTN|nr:4'-phosphopantetheinyl transferase superfamily protein [Streptomyces katsurahamanus]MQS36393.1 4'-phosphopantetheinyl transferase superfamily protein [Streptomyces katsurahamanus]
MATEPPAGRAPTAERPPGVERLWSGRVPELAADALAHRRLLDAGESARLDAFLRPSDRDAYAVAHVALRRLLGERLGRSPESVALDREPCTHCDGPHGRPVVPGGAVHFSLSHTEGIVLIALASAPVGVDVESVPSPKTIADIAGQLHPRERDELAALPAGDRAPAFARCWTRKESVLKAIGVGLNDGLRHPYVGTGPRPVVDPAWRLTDLETDPGYAAAVAVRTAG